MKAGVYLIELVGTPFVYVGESKDVEKRWREHAKLWVWPNDARYTLVRQMSGSDRKTRVRTEDALSRLMKRKGKIVLNVTSSHRSILMLRARNAQTASHRSAAWRSYTPEMRKARLAKAHATMNERASAIGSKGGKSTWAKYTPEERTERARMMQKAATISRNRNREAVI